MREGLENLASRDYPGRVIVIGKDNKGKNVFVIYAITGRSPSSQARKISREGDTLWVNPTEEEIIKQGKVELLVYPAVCLSRGIAVSNGRQTLDIKSRLAHSQNPPEILTSALSRWNYEPDAPIYTPRISGCVAASQGAALGIIKRGEDGSSIRNIFEVPLIEGKGWMVSTYQGENKDPVEPFSGEPQELEINQDNSNDLAEAVYEALAPREGERDLRIAVACVFSPGIDVGKFAVSIINRVERIDDQNG